jgi:hypothetical protein
MRRTGAGHQGVSSIGGMAMYRGPFLSGPNSYGKRRVGLWVGAGSTQRNAETQSSTARSPTACADLSGTAAG